MGVRWDCLGFVGRHKGRSTVFWIYVSSSAKLSNCFALWDPVGLGPTGWGKEEEEFQEEWERTGFK